MNLPEAYAMFVHLTVKRRPAKKGTMSATRTRNAPQRPTAARHDPELNRLNEILFCCALVAALLFVLGCAADFILHPSSFLLSP